MAASRKLFSLAALALATSLTASAQTAPGAVPVPFTTSVAGIGAAASQSACTTGYLTTDGSTLGDGCAGTQGKLTAPQGATVDSYNNAYVGDYLDHAVRVVYNGNPALAAAIKAANSGYTIGYGISSPRSAPSPTPVVGDIYTIAGVGANSVAAQTYVALTVTNTDGKYACGNFAGNPDALNNLGDGCPAASAVVGPRDVKLDNDGNLFITDYTNNRIRVLCVACGSSNLATALITLENPGVTPVNGAMYTIAGYSSGYRDQALGYGNPTAATVLVALMRSPTGAVVSPSDDVYVADNLNNAVRVLYNGGAAAKAILLADGYTPTKGYMYTIAGNDCVSALSGKTGSVSTANACLAATPTGQTAAGASTGFNSCGSSSPTADTSCVESFTTVGSQITSYGVSAYVVWSVYLDPYGNVYYSDAGNARIKVIYAGGTNPLTLTGTLQTGAAYSFAGQGTGVAGAVTNVAPSSIPLPAGSGSGPQGVGGDAFGNIFFLDYSNALLYETYAATGLTSIIAGQYGNATPTTGAYCNSLTTGPKMTDASYNGCPATQSKFTSTRGPIVADMYGNLYFGDALAYFIRKFSYNSTFPATAVGSTATAQSYAFAIQSATTAVTSESLELSGAATTEFTDAGNDVCTVAAGNTCVYTVNFTPKLPGARAGSIVLNGTTGVIGTTTFVGTGNGSALAVDPGTLTTTGTGYAPNGIAVDGAGNVYFTDATSKSLVKYSGTTASTVATGFTVPAGVAIDNSGSLFVADSSANTVTEIPVVGGTKYTLLAGLNAPHNLTTDSLGRVYVADTGNNRVLVLGTGATKTVTVLGFTGLTAPQAVAVDSNFNVYALDSTHIVKLTTAGVQSTIATVSAGTGIGVDAAGNVVMTTAGALIEYPVTGTATTLYPSLTAAKALVLDGSGNAFVADSSAGGYTELQRTAGYYKFITTSGSTTINLSSIGTVPVSSTAYTQSDSTDYSLVSATTNGCSGALASGTTCALTATFAPKGPGVLTDHVAFTAAVNNGSPTLTLINVSLIPAVTVQASPGNIAYGATETLTATAYGPSNTSGNVAFFNNGSTTPFATIPVDSTATAKYSYTPAAGSYSITATFTPMTGSPVSTTSATTFTVSQATPTVSVVPSPASGYTTTTFTLTANVTSTVGTPSGSVLFFSNGTQLNSSQAFLSGGTVSIMTTLPLGTDCITVQYSGDNNFAKLTTTCQNVNVAAGFGVTASSTMLTFQQGYQEAQAILSFNPGGRSDTISYSCSGLPAKVSCSFSPATLTLNGGSTTQTVQMLVSNSGATSGDLHDGPAAGFFGAKTVAVAALPFAALLLFGIRRRKPVLLLALLLLSLGTAASLTGCSGQDPTSKYQASGSYPFTVTVTSGATTLQTLSFTLTIP